MKIVVIGGTGLIGSKTAAILRQGVMTSRSTNALPVRGGSKWKGLISRGPSRETSGSISAALD